MRTSNQRGASAPRFFTPDTLRAFRARHRLTQPQAAAALGVTVRTLQEWEQGRQRPDQPGPIERLIVYIDRCGLIAEPWQPPA